MSTRGLPWWAVALGATVVVAVGGLLGGPYFPGALVAGCVLAAIAAHRSAFFTVVAQPPLIVTAIAVATLLFGQSLLGAVAQLSSVFPYLVVTMAAVGSIVVVRLRLDRRASSA